MASKSMNGQQKAKKTGRWPHFLEVKRARVDLPILVSKVERACEGEKVVIERERERQQSPLSISPATIQPRHFRGMWERGGNHFRVPPAGCGRFVYYATRRHLALLQTIILYVEKGKLQEKGGKIFHEKRVG